MRTTDDTLEILEVAPVLGKFDPDTGLRLPSGRFRVAAQDSAGVRFTLDVVTDDESTVQPHAAASPLHHWRKEG